MSRMHYLPLSSCNSISPVSQNLPLSWIESASADDLSASARGIFSNRLLLNLAGNTGQHGQVVFHVLTV